MKFSGLKTDWIVITICICILGVISSVIIHSRSFTIGYCTCLLFLSCLKLQFDWKKSVYAGFIFILLFSLGTAYFLKVDSALGRVLIYKISFALFRDNYISGVGFRQFNHAYMLYQAEYFKAGQYTTKEMLLAGNVYCAYNDYLQIAIEKGIIGIAVVALYLTAIVSVFHYILYNNLYRSFIVLTGMTQLVVLSVAGCFTFIYERPVFQIILVASFTILIFKVVNHSHTKQGKYLLPLFFIVWIGFISFFIYYWKDQYETSQLLKHTQELSEGGYKNEALSILKPLYPGLKSNIEYLHQLGIELYNRHEYSEALGIFQQESKVESNNSIYRMLGRCYLEKQNFSKAESSFITAISMVPNRLTERVELYKFYKQTHQVDNAHRVKRMILSLQIKIPSFETYLIKYKLENDPY